MPMNFDHQLRERMLPINGAPRKNGKTASLVKAFTESSDSAGYSGEKSTRL